MPSRFTMLGILAFWLIASGWLFYRDIWPSLKPGEPPPFVIDLSDEANARASQIRWKVLKNGEEKGYALTYVQNNSAEGTYRLNCEYKFFSAGRYNQKEADQVITSAYGVTSEGELRDFQVSIVFRANSTVIVE